MFFVVVELTGTKEVLRKLLYADDVTVVADEETDLQEQLIEWKDMFNRHGLRVSLEKTEVMWVGPRRKELDIHLDGKKLKRRDSFVYLGGAICGDGNSDTEISPRITAVANAWRKVEEVMGDRRMSSNVK